MSEEQEDDKKFSFKQEWNEFSIYCWYLMDKCMARLNEDEKIKFKMDLLKAEKSKDKVKIIVENNKIMNYLKNTIEYSSKKYVVDNKKDSKFSLDFKKAAKNFTDKDDYEKALKFISKAIMFYDCKNNYFHEDSNNYISQLYLLRAKLLIKTQNLKYAQMDLKEALKLNSDIELQDLELKNLFNYKKTSIDEIQLKEINNLLEGASSSVKMDYSNEKGRLINSTRDIEEGEILFMEEPYVHWLRPSYFNQYCHHCLRKLEKHIFYPCNYCIDIKYCSVTCKEISWKRYHRTECKFLKLLKKWPSGHMALRLVLRDGIDFVLDEDNKEDIDLNEWPKIGFKSNYSSIKSLIGENIFSEEDYYYPLILGCVLISLLLQKSGEIQDSNLIQFASVLIKSIMQILENTFMIYDYSIKPIENDDFLEENHKKNKKTKFHQISSSSSKIGVGLYSSTSLIPHSCNNNCNKFYINNSILIVASRPIKANEEVNIEYGVHYKVNSVKDRKEYLSNNFGFDCKCTACCDKLENEVLSYKCPNCLKGALIRNKDNTNYCLSCNVENINLETLDEFILKAEEDFQKGIEAFKLGNVKKSELEFKKVEKVFDKIFYNEAKSQMIKTDLSHFYTSEKKFDLAYQYLAQTFPMNQFLYGENSIEVLTNHIELALLAISSIDSLSSLRFNVKQISQKLFKKFFIKLNKQNNFDQILSKLDFLDLKNISNYNEISRWKIIFKKHFEAILSLYEYISEREVKIISEESINSLYKLTYLRKYSKTVDQI